MANTALNRSLVVILTNKTGGSVSQGDVVILSKVYQSSFETVAQEAYTDSLVGVVLEPGGIANNSQGGVCLGGYTPKINLNSPGGGPGQYVKTSGLKRGSTTYLVANGSFATLLGSGTSPAAMLFNPVVGV